MSIGLYLHIPFCRSKCAYCDFTSYPGLESLMPAYVRGVRSEIEMYRSILSGNEIATVYLGGGTPSLLPPALLEELLTPPPGLFGEGAEITMEANPGTLTRQGLASFVKRGGTRLSLGVQTHDPELLALIGRRHTADEAAASVRLARGCGVGLVNLDLMYGLPGQTVENWRETIHFALSLAPEHVSVYCLETHPGTPLAGLIEAGGLTLPGEDDAFAMANAALAMLTEAGLPWYEIAGFAKPGAECRHNLNYWRNGSYLGLGAAAHSHIGAQRWSNLEHPETYLAAVAGGRFPVAAAEEIGPREDLLETVMLGIRLKEGIADAVFRERFGCGMEELFGRTMADFEERGLLDTSAGRLRLTDAGLPVADHLLRALVRSLPDPLTMRPRRAIF